MWGDALAVRQLFLNRFRKPWSSPLKVRNIPHIPHHAASALPPKSGRGEQKYPTSTAMRLDLIALLRQSAEAAFRAVIPSGIARRKSSFSGQPACRLRFQSQIYVGACRTFCAALFRLLARKVGSA
jgi:hypothetical protein